MRLEDFIKDNLEAFTTEEPPKGHFERFEQRLKASKQGNKRRNIRWLISIAAVMAGVIISLTLFINREQTGSQVCVLSGEMLETQNYYLSVINTEAAHAEKLLANADPETQAEVRNDIRTIVKGSNSFASEFCNSSDGSIAIMVEFYQAKIQALQNIISIFDTNNRATNNSSKIS